MLLLDVTLPTLEENLALDEALLCRAEEGGPEALRLWEWPSRAVVLGAGCQLAKDVAEAACREDAVPIRRRSSGGGTVLLGQRCLLYSLILSMGRAPQLQHIRPSFAWILQRMIDALAPLGIEAKQAGISDLILDGRKFSGNAQQRKSAHLLHHGTLLCGFDSAGVERYLRVPVRQPEYRGGRSHREFLGNLPLSIKEVRTLVSRAWQADGTVSDQLGDEVARLVQEKYLREDWIRRR